MQLLPWEGAGASLCTAPLSHSQSVFGKWNRSIHLRAAPAIGASQPEKSVPLQGRISLQAQNSTSLLRGSQHPAELGGHPLHPADKLLAAWRGYTDESCFIFAETDGEPHNTITPIARMRDGKYQLDLVLRNNITTPEHPLGVFHPHAKLHHIKKENIGLIEVMGLAVLPSRLKKELFELADALVARTPVSQYPEELQKHAEWAEDILARHPELNGDTVHLILQDEVGQVFAQVLADAGVYKLDEAGRAGFVRFLASVK